MPVGHLRSTFRRLGVLGTAGLIALSLSASVTAEDEAPAVDEAPLVLTPAQAEGPYYPVEIPLDHDADLTFVGGLDVVAAGQPLALEGVLLRADGSPIEGATVEIWQTDTHGVYLHPDDPDFADRDTAFQGFGRSITDGVGAWRFRTILPEVYGGRPRHIHAKIKVDDQTVLVTQIYFSGGDVPTEGAIETTGTEFDALLVEPYFEVDLDGQEVLTARHRIVVP